MKKRLAWLGVILLPFCLLTGCFADTSPQEAGTFALTFITIGKGDAFLLTTPEHRHFLVDTGKAQDYARIARTLRVKGTDRLDGIFLTHGHKDHAGCLDTLLGAFPTEKVYLSGRDTVTYKDIDPWEITSRRGVELAELSGGETLDLGGVTAKVWLPPTVDRDNENNNSMVLHLTHGNKNFLLMGDAEKDEETALLLSEFPLRADVLKLGHHGEDDATQPAFLNKVRPSVALIAGNAEENPDSVNDTITEALQRRNITAYYSEGDGLGLDFLSDGSIITVADVPDGDLPQSLHLALKAVDRKEQRVTVRNEDTTPADLSGCLLVSESGDEHFLFPDGTTLAPGESLTVACKGQERPGDLLWNEEKVWKKKKDPALLYDRNLNLLDEDR